MANYFETYAGRKRLQTNLRSWAVEKEADYFITAAFNRQNSKTVSTPSPSTARYHLKRWHARIDKKLLGKHWATADIDDRLFFVAFIEKLDSNPHWHMAVKLADPSRAMVFEAKAAECWEKIIPSGELDVQKNDTDLDVFKTGFYSAKDQWKSRNYNEATISEDFLTQYRDIQLEA